MINLEMTCSYFKCFDCLSSDARAYYDANNRVIGNCGTPHCCVKCEHLKECYIKSRLCAYLRGAFKDQLFTLMVLGHDYHTIIWTVKH